MSNQTIIDCEKLDTCDKVNFILDKDFPDWMYPVQISALCQMCKERKPFNDFALGI